MELSGAIPLSHVAYALVTTLLSLGLAVFYRDVVRRGHFDRAYITGQLTGLVIFVFGLLLADLVLK